MNKNELKKHWSDQITKLGNKPVPEPESTDPRKQKIWRKPEALIPTVKTVPDAAKDE